jgi:hypothetical protein
LIDILLDLDFIFLLFYFHFGLHKIFFVGQVVCNTNKLEGKKCEPSLCTTICIEKTECKNYTKKLEMRFWGLAQNIYDQNGF